jgi:hypothetical protein
MNPIAKCCGYYCSAIMILGIVFYAILILMLGTGSKTMVAPGPNEAAERSN